MTHEFITLLAALALPVLSGRPTHATAVAVVDAAEALLDGRGTHESVREATAMHASRVAVVYAEETTANCRRLTEASLSGDAEALDAAHRAFSDTAVAYSAATAYEYLGHAARVAGTQDEAHLCAIGGRYVPE